jgi:uncharacterized protein YjbI with pentapeptide repeats
MPADKKDEQTDLSGANLHGASLRCAHLGGTDLTDANLKEADLRDAVLKGFKRGAEQRLLNATLKGADLADAKGSPQDKVDCRCGYAAAGSTV